MENQKKWYDNKGLLIILFFIFPPMGIYGIIKKKTATWKKILYIIPASFSIILLISAIIWSFFMNHYEIGIDYYNNKNYKEAYNSFKLVPKDDEHYSDAKIKMDSLSSILFKQQLEADSKRIELKELKKKKKKELEEKELIKNNPHLSYPKIQQNFIKAIEQSYINYKKATNELKKSAVRTQRGKLIKSTLGNTRNFSDWVCIVESLETTSKGKAIFTLEIKDTDIEIMTWNNEVSDTFDSTLITQSNPLYNIISDLKKGDRVKVSGSFLKSNKNDYIQEMSMFEKSSMKKPDFIVRFTKIEKY